MKPRNLLTKIVTVILFSLLILSFAVWGIGDIFRGGGQSQMVAEIGDTGIDQREYTEAVANEIGSISRQIGTPLTIEQARAFGIPQQVLSRLISRAVLDELATRMSLLVTEDQMRGQIFENPAFQGATGRFDQNRFAQALSYANLTEQRYLSVMGSEIMRRQLTAAATESAVAPQSLAKQLLSYRGERRVGDYLIVANDSFGNLGDPDAEALQETYDAAGGSFMTSAYKSISLAVLSLSEAAKGIAISDERVEEAFEARKDELSTPERRTILQAVVPDQAAAQALADRLSEGAEFTAAVEEATGRGPVDLGTVAQTQLLPQLGEAVFALEATGPSAPIQSPLGWHVVMVTAIEPGEEASLEASREDLRNELAEAEAVDVVIGLANQFDDALAGGASLEDVASRLNLTLRSIPNIDRQARDPEDNLVEGLPSISEFLGVLNATQPGDTSLLTDTLDGDYFIIRVDGETPAKRKSLVEVSDDVAELWRVAEGIRLAEEKATALAERLKSGEDFAELAATEGLELSQTQPITRFESDPERTPAAALSQQLFEIDTGEVTTVATANSHIVVKLKEILEPDSAGSDAQLAQIEQQLTTSLQNDIFQQFLGALQQEFDVTVNQRLIDQVLAEF